MCAAESAAQNAAVPVVVVLTSPQLNVCANNATAQVWRRRWTNLHFRYAEPLATLRQSHFGPFAANGIHQVPLIQQSSFAFNLVDANAVTPASFYVPARVTPMAEGTMGLNIEPTSSEGRRFTTA